MQGAPEGRHKRLVDPLLAEKMSFRQITRGIGVMKSRRALLLYVDLENATCNTANPCGLDAAGVPANHTVKFNANLIRLGVDYKFR
ncbi:MAG: hypothetical protein WBE25_16885 [Xanthobacteraceae bacterium]